MTEDVSVKKRRSPHFGEIWKTKISQLNWLPILNALDNKFIECEQWNGFYLQRSIRRFHLGKPREEASPDGFSPVTSWTVSRLRLSSDVTQENPQLDEGTRFSLIYMLILPGGFVTASRWIDPDAFIRRTTPLCDDFSINWIFVFLHFSIVTEDFVVAFGFKCGK